VSPALIQIGGSIAAILVLAAIAWGLKLGGGTIADAAQARAEAEAIFSGFDAGRVVLASDGRAAIVHGGDGSVALLKVHGAHVVGRRLTLPLDVRVAPDGLMVASGERRFGSVLLRGVAEI
jgi:anti-sigma factor RsiW